MEHCSKNGSVHCRSEILWRLFNWKDLHYVSRTKDISQHSIWNTEQVSSQVKVYISKNLTKSPTHHVWGIARVFLKGRGNFLCFEIWKLAPKFNSWHDDEIITTTWWNRHNSIAIKLQLKIGENPWNPRYWRMFDRWYRNINDCFIVHTFLNINHSNSTIKS